MTDSFLRYHLNEAVEQGKTGLLIWSSDRIAEFFSDLMEPGYTDYDFALEQVNKNEDATISVEWTELLMPAFLAVPVKKLKESAEYFDKVMRIVQEKNYNGPISIIPY